MNQAGEQRQGTMPFPGPSMAPSGVGEVVALSPRRLADLMLAAPLARQASLVLLEPAGETSTVSMLRGTKTFAELRVVSDVANAAAARLAAVAGIDPLAEHGALDRQGNVGRVTVRSGTSVADLLVSIVAHGRGIEAEVRVLSVDGRAPDLRAQARLHRCTRCAAFQVSAEQSCEIDGAPMVEVEDNPTLGGTIGLYRLLSSLGEGGGGSVFAGEHALLGRPVAIKLLHRDLAKDPALARRFLHEARAASRLRHPSIVDVTDFGVLGNGFPYMVMERLSGEPLDVRLARAGALEPTAALLLAREVAVALGVAHDAGLAHNDLKPANVIVLDESSDRAPKIKLIDFGAATLVGMHDDVLFGTPGYMPPERIHGAPSDGRGDFYSLGVLLYEMLSGARPFAELTQRAVLLAQLRDPFPPLVSPFGPLPPAVLRLIDRATRLKADERQQSAGEVVADLEGALSTLGRTGSRKWLP